MDSQPIVTINPGDGAIAARDSALTDQRKHYVYGNPKIRPGTYLCVETTNTIFFYVSLFHDDFWDSKTCYEVELKKAREHLFLIGYTVRKDLGLV
jgi:hypothetical protein